MKLKGPPQKKYTETSTAKMASMAKICKQIIKKTGLECGNKIKGGVAEVCKKHMPKEPKPKAPVEDKMTEDATRFLMAMFVDNAKREIEFTARFGLKHRREGMSAELSENIIKYAIRSRGDATCTWACEVGDLYSDVEKVQECKSFTSTGPTSFGPHQKWDVIYFLDARGALEDKLVIWRIGLPSVHEFWTTLPVNKTQTKADQAGEDRRPRQQWSVIQERVTATHPEAITEFYNGTFEGVFVPK
jgi:hypothetical protein